MLFRSQATENTVEPVVIAMSSAFNAFPSGPQAGPALRKTVEYGTGIVVSGDGAIVADRQVTDGCLAIAIAGFGNADRIAEDKDHDLALLRIYGARGLKPLGLASGGADKTSIELTGISDPQSQSGGRAATTVKAAVTPVGGGGDLALSPTPGSGFSGAAARDDGGKFAGLALLKSAVVAGSAANAPAQSVLVPAEAVRDFLKTNGVSTADGSSDAVASVVRVICVRK